MWTPDVYEGSPTPVTAFFATAPKMAAMGLFARVVHDAFGGVVGAAAAGRRRVPRGGVAARSPRRERRGGLSPPHRRGEGLPSGMRAKGAALQRAEEQQAAQKRQAHHRRAT